MSFVSDIDKPEWCEEYERKHDLIVTQIACFADLLGLSLNVAKRRSEDNHILSTYVFANLKTKSGNTVVFITEGRGSFSVREKNCPAVWCGFPEDTAQAAITYLIKRCMAKYATD